MSAPQTANEVVKHLGELARELNASVEQIRAAEADYLAKRAAYELAHSKAFLGAEGSMDMRKHQAVIATHDLRVDADVADAAVRHLRRQIDALRVRIDVGRSYGAAIRAELSALGGE